MKNYIEKKDVPILDEHVLYDEEGKELAQIDEARLKHIADLANKRCKDTGDEVPIIIGHTKDDVSEDKQPKIVGYASNFQVKRFFKTNRKAITATFKFFKKYLNRIKEYPRRSIELWLNDWKIDPISLLGATTPERDLGLLRLQKGGTRKVHLIYKGESKTGANMVSQETKGVVDAVLSAIKQMDFYKWACQKMKEDGFEEGEDQGAGFEGEEASPGFDGDDEDLGAEEMTGQGLSEGEDEAEGDEGMEVPPEAEEEEEPARYAACSGTNTYTPNKGKKKMSKSKVGSGRERVLLRQYEKGFKHLQQEHEKLKRRFQRSEREKDLIQMTAEGYDLDIDEELDDLQQLPEPRYQATILKMRRKYNKVAVGFGDDNSPFNHGVTNTVPVASRKASVEQAIQLAAAKGISFEEALSHTTK